MTDGVRSRSTGAPMPASLGVRGFHFVEDGAKWIVKGATYGPFRPDRNGDPYPATGRIAADFDAMAAAGVNTVRLYTTPTDELADMAAGRGLRLLVDVPWPKHLDVYGDARLEAMCLDMVDRGVESASRWSNVLGVMAGNEIPPDIARWAGPDRVEDFLRRLHARAKRANPDMLVGFANFPSTEFLRLGFFDFLGFNVYIEEEEALRRYLRRLRHLYPETPLLLSETGLDTLGNGEGRQAQVLEFSIRAAMETGMAGVLVFSWTDEWHTGGYDINDWKFGLVDKERRPKPALGVVADLFAGDCGWAGDASLPKASVVVASYNGASTLAECLESLGRLRYPDYEVVVVDDGSTDSTARILPRFPWARVVSQENKGLSAARNAGIAASTGEIVAFTDSDCVADPDWLALLAKAMMAEPCAGAGGPNLTPWEERPLHRTVACAPGHATHVLLDDIEAEHVPGCNMGFWRAALQQVGCFDPQFRKAGDDVDIIWRMQDQGMRILYAPGAFVWHHRRSTLGAYLRQQKGYGEAEALLARKHPQRFNDRGQSLWRGVIYSGQEMLPLGRTRDVHFGVFGSAGFQCVYERRAGFLSHFAGSFEWWVACGALGAAGIFSRHALWAAAAMAAFALAARGIRAWRQFRDAKGVGRAWFPVVWMLWVLQPIARGWKRSLGIFVERPSAKGFLRGEEDGEPRPRPRLAARLVRAYWGEDAPPRLDAIALLEGCMRRRGWLYSPNSGWEPWDFALVLSKWFRSRVQVSEEDHGAGRRMLRLRAGLVPTSLLAMAGGAGLAACALVAMQDTVLARLLLIALLVAGWLLYAGALKSQAVIADAFEQALEQAGFHPQHARVERPQALGREQAPTP